MFNQENNLISLSFYYVNIKHTPILWIS